jgi:tRNA(fMet)-specific endonuclease VapC
MLILDTDHLTALDQRSAAGANLERQLEIHHPEVCSTIISVSEQLSGLLALIKSVRTDVALIENYGRLAQKVEDLREFVVLPWSADSAAVFQRLRRTKLRIGTLDLRIASIAIANDATLLSWNLGDFEKVPGLRVEDWLK